jgi:hypothetical protein
LERTVIVGGLRRECRDDYALAPPIGPCWAAAQLGRYVATRIAAMQGYRRTVKRIRLLTFLVMAVVAGFIGRDVPVFGMPPETNSDDLSTFDKNKYRPAGNPFPQIIQADDYATIRAIETLERTLHLSFLETISCEKLIHVVTVVRNGPEQFVLIGSSKYSSDDTIVVFETFERIVADLTRRHSCDGGRAEHHAARAYRRITIIDVDFGPNVVELESLSNGPDDSERLYVLDVVPRKESFFWFRPQ